VSEAIQPPDFMESVYGPSRRSRAADHPLFTTLRVADLFPEIGAKIYDDNDDVSAIRRAAEEALTGVDMSKIGPNDTVNLLASEHGFGILDGRPYVEMLKTIRDIVIERTGCKRLRLRLAMYRGFREAEETNAYFELEDYFDGKVVGLGPFDKGVEIETRIGKLYGVARAFDAKHFIHAYYDDPREMYFNRLLYKSFKSFCMSYARMETRSIYHSHFGNRSGSLIPRAIFDSDFIQQRYAFSCVLRTSPAGIIGVDAGTDLYEIDRQITRDHLASYGKMQRLFGEIEDCIAVWDGGRWGYYLHAGGLIFGVLLTNDRDPFDLDLPVLANAIQDPRDPYIFCNNPSLKAVVVNQSWVGAGIPYLTMPIGSPMFVVGEDQADLWRKDSSNPIAGARQNVVENLDAGLAQAQEVGGTDKVIVFDGSFGRMTVSPSMAEFLKSRAGGVRQRVEEELLPKWLRQRGLDAGTSIQAPTSTSSTTATTTATSTRTN
jgi:hypothetical protein